MNSRLVREWLEINKLKPEALAARLGVSMGTINRIFAGRTPSWPTVIALAHVMGVKESDLVDKNSCKTVTLETTVSVS